MSNTHEARIIRIGEVRPHPNADKLELTNIGSAEGYQMVIGKGQFKPGDLAVFIQPESIVPQTQSFEFIWREHVGIDGVVPERRRLIRPKRLRGEWSEGLLMPASEFSYLTDLTVDTDVAEAIGVTHYVPEFDRESTKAESAAAPRRKYPRTLRGWFFWALHRLGFRKAGRALALEVGFHFPIYDIDALKGSRRGFSLGESVLVTEKIHGSNARYVFIDGVQYCGSHEQWKADGNNVWWNAYRQVPEIAEWCCQNPGVVLYGEVGPTQGAGFRYGAGKDKAFFFAFDVFVPSMDNPKLPSYWNWPGFWGFKTLAPVLYLGPYEPETINSFVDGPSTVPGANQIREGIVVRSLSTGRKRKIKSNEFLKIVGNR